MPHLFYESQSTKVPITNEDITTKYKLRETDTDLTKEPRSHRLNITYVAYSASGILQDIGVVNGGMFQMCNGSFQEFDAAFNFGTRYSKKCRSVEWEQLSADFAETSWGEWSAELHCILSRFAHEVLELCILASGHEAVAVEV